eukprot:TRINITY_DN10076_c0_g5_i2.p1 TRINITY_DN10076_c0_g5~~TRINITY_DN10076_c0_g5_i2.p1  ORF type:complete len:534 (+),score=104.00 TRINITY_DN10076_c0_g5_i2:54-1604(+)
MTDVVNNLSLVQGLLDEVKNAQQERIKILKESSEKGRAKRASAAVETGVIELARSAGVEAAMTQIFDVLLRFGEDQVGSAIECWLQHAPELVRKCVYTNAPVPEALPTLTYPLPEGYLAGKKPTLVKTTEKVPPARPTMTLQIPYFNQFLPHASAQKEPEKEKEKEPEPDPEPSVPAPTGATNRAVNRFKQRARLREELVQNFYNTLQETVKDFRPPEGDDGVTPIGKGSHAQIFKVTPKTGQVFARKIVKITGDKSVFSTTEELKDRIQKLELEIFVSTLDCPYLLKSLRIGGVMYREVYIDLPLMDCDLRKLLQLCATPVSEPVVGMVMVQVVAALVFLHSKEGKPSKGRVIHRDIKPDNILVNRKGEVRLIDFGVAKSISSTPDRHTFAVGNLHYMAPEMMNPNYDGKYSTPVDLWSVGMIIFHMIAGRYPMPYSEHTLCQKIMTFDWNNPSDWKKPATASEDVLDFIEKLLSTDPDARVTAEEALRHPFLIHSQNESDKSLIDWIDKCLEAR